MKAAFVPAAERPPVYGDFPDPTPAAGERLVTVTASALSPFARGRAKGAHYSASGAYPFVVGVDGVGRLNDGARVYFVLPHAPHGGMAEKTVVAEAQCLPLPDDLDDITAAAIANPAMSSWAALVERAQLKPGETVLVNGATGAAGSLAVRIARYLGAGKVIATGRNAEALARVGADATIPLVADAEEMQRAFRAACAEGVDVVVDYLWGPSAEALLVAAAKEGREGATLRYVEVGSMGGANIALPSAALRAADIALMGSGIGSVPRGRLFHAIAGAFRAAVQAGLRIETEAVALADFEQAWARTDGGPRLVFTP